eukprot:11191677-Alexandrium_andersonii.AAC.1
MACAPNPQPHPPCTRLLAHPPVRDRPPRSGRRRAPVGLRHIDNSTRTRANSAVLSRFQRLNLLQA